MGNQVQNKCLVFKPTL